MIEVLGGGEAGGRGAKGVGGGKGESRGVGKEREEEEEERVETEREEAGREDCGGGGEWCRWRGRVITPRAFRCCLSGGGLTGVNHQIRVQYYLIVIVN